MPEYNPLRLHEDNVGNPIQLLFGLVMLMIPTVLIKYNLSQLKKSAWIIAILPIASWTIMMLVIGATKYIARYHLPIFYLLPFFLLGVGVLWKQKIKTRKPIFYTVITFFVVGFSYGNLAVIKNETRPLL